MAYKDELTVLKLLVPRPLGIFRFLYSFTALCLRSPGVCVQTIGIQAAMTTAT